MTMFKLRNLRKMTATKPFPKSSSKQVRDFVAITSTIRHPPGPGWQFEGDPYVGQGFVMMKENANKVTRYFFGMLGCVLPADHKNADVDAAGYRVQKYHGVFVDNNDTYPEYPFILPDIESTKNPLVKFVHLDIIYQIAKYGVDTVDKEHGCYLNSETHKVSFRSYKAMMAVRSNARRRGGQKAARTKAEQRKRAKRATTSGNDSDPDYEDEIDGTFITPFAL